MNNVIMGYKMYYGFFDFGGGYMVDFGNIVGCDFQKFYGNLLQVNQIVQKLQIYMFKIDVDKMVVVCMLMGMVDQFEIKLFKYNGGFLMYVIDIVFKVEGKLLDWVFMVVGVLSFIFGIGEFVDVVFMVLEVEF